MKIFNIFRKQHNKMPSKEIFYSDKYNDDSHEYRHVILPKVSVIHVRIWYLTYFMYKDMAKLVPKNKLMSESEWRNIGVQQSQGWVHYMIHEPEPNILLFKRPLPNPSAA